MEKALSAQLLEQTQSCIFDACEIFYYRFLCEMRSDFTSVSGIRVAVLLSRIFYSIFQAIELAADALANVKFIQEKKLIGGYFDEISQVRSFLFCF